MKKIIKIVLFIFAVIITFSGWGYAATIMQSLDVTYDNSESGLSATNVQEALDELYLKLNPSITKLIDHITDLYMNNKDSSLVTNNSIQYRYSSSVSLMNDRQGSMSVGEDDGNIRYYGANPNNYIYFNCSDYNNQSDATCEKWRIIGIVDGKVKIIRNESLAAMSWDYTSSGSYDNNWHDATLNTLLNFSFYNGDTTGTIQYSLKGIDGDPTTLTLDMKELGIKNDTTRALISPSTWYLGGYSTIEGLYANDIYIYERKNSTETIYTGNKPSIEANIGLMYVSDYGYAIDFTKCSLDLGVVNDYHGNSGCYGEKWLELGMEGGHLATITPRSSSSYEIMIISPYGSYVRYDLNSSFSSSVVPTLYLNSELGIEEGHIGTSDDPYRLIVE